MAELAAFVVEDSAVHQRLLAAAFKATGHTVRLDLHASAEDALAALETLLYRPRAEWPDIALVDVGLPGMDGIELVDRIRQKRPFDALPIVILTASRDPEDRTESLLAQADAYFTKPATAAGYARLARQVVVSLGVPAAMDPPAPSPASPQPRKKTAKHAPVRGLK